MVLIRKSFSSSFHIGSRGLYQNQNPKEIKSREAWRTNCRVDNAKLGSNCTSQESSLPNILFSKTLEHDYQNLCSLDVLGVYDRHVNWDEILYNEFQK